MKEPGLIYLFTGDGRQNLGRTRDGNAGPGAGLASQLGCFL